MASRSPFVVTPAQHRPFHVVGETISVLASAEQTGSGEIFFQQGPEGAGPPPHTHPWDEAYYVLDGQIDVTVGPKQITLSKGEFIYIPAMTLHCFRMKTAQASFLSINNKGGASRFFGELDREVGGSLDIPKLLAVAGRHEVKIPPPPGAP